IAIGVAVRARARRELDAVMVTQVDEAAAAAGAAHQLAEQRDAARSHAFGLFDNHHWSDGEAAWDQVEELARREAGEFRAASGNLETALALAPDSATLRGRFADLTFERLLRAERDHHGELT